MEFVMLRLSLQLLLIWVASFREYLKLIMLYWLAYLLADWAVVFAIALIQL